MRSRWPYIALACFLPLAIAQSPRPLESGNRLLAQRHWTAAAEEFRTALKLHPQSAGAHIGLGIALWGAGDRPGALAEFQRAIAANPASAQAHYSVALALRDGGEPAPAIAEVREALKLKPDYDEARLALGLLLQQTGDVPSAMAEYRWVLKRNPRSAEAHNWLGVAYMQKNQLRDAVSEFRQAVKLKPDFVRAYNNLGSTLAQAGDVQEGIDAFEAGLKHAPGEVALHVNLGTALRTKGDAEAAISHFATVLKTSPDDPEVHYQLGQTLRQKGDLEAAIGEFEAALNLNPEYQDSYYGLGQTLRQLAARKRSKTTARPANSEAQEQMKRGAEALARGDVPGAVDWFRKATLSDADSAEAFNALGFALGRARDLPRALTSLRQAVALNPGLAEAHFNLGAALWYGREKARAAAELDEAIRLNPAAGEAYSLRGIAYRDAGDLASARTMLQRSVALNPKLPAGYFDLALLLLRMNQMEHASGQFEAGLNLPSPPGPPPDLDVAIREFRSAIGNTRNAEAHNLLGRLLGLAGADPKQVIAEFETAIQIRPEYAEAHNHLGLVYTQTGNDEKAIAAYREAIRQQPGYADAHANLGAILAVTDVAESIRELEKAVSLRPTLLKAHYNLAVAYGSSPAHGPEKEIEELWKLIAVEPNYPRAEFSLGKALLRKGAVQEAIAALQRAAQAEPDFGEAHYQLGLALTRAGERENGAAELQKGLSLIAANQRDQTLLLDLNEGKAALEKGELDQAMAKFGQIAKHRPDLDEVHYYMGLTLSRKGDRDGATLAFQKTLQLNPEHAGAKQGLDKLQRSGTTASDSRLPAFEGYIRDRKFQELEPLLQAYLQERPDAARGWYMLGYSLFAQQKIGESINALSKSLSLDVTNADAHKVLGRDLMLIGRLDAAQLEFEQGAKYDSRSAEMQYNLGRLFSIQDLWPAAKRAFEAALKLDSSYMEAYDGLGFAFEALGEEASAIANYEKAVRLNESRKAGFASPYVNLSALNNRSGNADAAFEFARQAIQVNPKSDRGWFQLAKAYERRGELDSAADALNRAIAINGHASSYYYVLGNVYRRLGKPKESREAMKKFSELERASSELDQKRHQGAKQEGSLRD